MEASAPLTPTNHSVGKNCAVVMGKYQLGRLLGRGSFAKVYKATSMADGSSVAIKVIEKSRPMTTLMEPQIMREVAVMKRLRSHPNILKIHEVMATKTRIFLVMELASGGELFTKVRRQGRISEGAARRYFQQLVDALRFCHENGMAHRDIKPQNLLLDKSNVLKVSDFGLSALPEQLRKDGLLHTSCGTPSYTAPEVLYRRGYDGAKADAWSCGVVLFVLLAGYIPFDDTNLVGLYKKINSRDYRFPEWISKPARSLIHRLLDPNPATRMSLDTVGETAWFKRTLGPSNRSDSCPAAFLLQDNSLQKECELAAVSSMNAFDIISLSSGLNLSGLLETPDHQSAGKRFTSSANFEAISDKMREVGGRYGYSLEKGKGGSFSLDKGRVALAVEVYEITKSLFMVDVKVVGGGGAAAVFEESHWGGWRDGLQEIVLSWHNYVM
ncbi:hypothetical protein SAY86_002967 [Trapa natans]|uniref:non-specific serine/threonine protein kinase n=1 Tax=Trapa natans TaxID=22666 RepID=A0AAN7LS09_TRANT|nr:hypothetical protein SAY86_002967 [Trapa natans]